jgi:ABC-2 type transport system ATP-binding protein
MSVPIEVDSLTVEFVNGREKLAALQGLSFSVPQGSVVGFIGPNGAGKTTTIHILLGFIEASRGTARIFGDDVRRQSARQRIGYLPEHPQSYDFLKGEELLAMSGRLFGLKGRELKRRIAQTLELVDLEAAAKRRIASY